MKRDVQKSHARMINSNAEMDSAFQLHGAVVNTDFYHEIHFALANNSFPQHVQLDGEVDCPDGDSSDEENCHTNSTNTICKPNYFQCADGTNCIPSSWQW